MEWIKSSFCDSASCVEVAFVKSSKSASNGACVEVAACDCHVKVRDSKDPDGAVLTFTLQEWDAFVAGAKAGEFDRTEDRMTQPDGYPCGGRFREVS